MKTIIKGKKIETKLELVSNSELVDNKRVYNSKPELITKIIELGWEDAYKVDDRIEYNSGNDMIAQRDGFKYVGYINVSEEEEVGILKSVYRADLNTNVLFMDKVSTVMCQPCDLGLNEKSLKAELYVQLKEYNTQMIASNKKLAAYCKLHNLVVEDTDYDLLVEATGGVNYDGNFRAAREGYLRREYEDRHGMGTHQLTDREKELFSVSEHQFEAGIGEVDMSKFGANKLREWLSDLEDKPCVAFRGFENERAVEMLSNYIESCADTPLEEVGGVEVGFGEEEEPFK